MIVDESYRGADLIFLVGCPRSGTTWLQRLLASHPRIRTGQESHLFDFYIGPQLHRWADAMAHAATGRGGVGIGCYLEEERFLAATRAYMLQLLAPMREALAPGELFLEKSPAHALYLPEIRRLLPEARVIHLVRDARDVVASLLAASRSWGAGWAPRTAGAAASLWIEHVQAARREASVFGPSRYLEVRYEELHAAPERTLERVGAFLGLAWPGDTLPRAIRQNQPGEARATGGTPLPIGGAFATARGVVQEPPGFVRRARPGAWKEDLSWREQWTVWKMGRELMDELGYPWRSALFPVLTRLAGLRPRRARRGLPPATPMTTGS